MIPFYKQNTFVLLMILLLPACQNTDEQSKAELNPYSKNTHPSKQRVLDDANVENSKNKDNTSTQHLRMYVFTDFNHNDKPDETRAGYFLDFDVSDSSDNVTSVDKQ